MRALLISLLVNMATSFLALSPSVASRDMAMAACRRNTKKEKRLRNLEYARQFRKGANNGAPKPQGKKKPLSRKKLAMKAQSAWEKEREQLFVTKLYTEIDPPSDADKIDLGII